MLHNSIKIKTRNVGRSASLWGYTLRINGQFLKMDFDGYNSESVKLADNIERATVFTSITTLRTYWAKYMPYIVALSTPKRYMVKTTNRGILYFDELPSNTYFCGG